MSEIKKYAINEDTIQCLFFVSSNNVGLWDELCVNINNTIKVLSHDYIWHKDEFHVYLPVNRENSVREHLVSNTCFADNIEDEWFIVYLVLEITKQYQDIIVQVMDNDGDFLLIEAADYLPTWANPDNTENRVFIYNNRIHIIPPNVVDLETELTLDNALSYIVDANVQTEIPTVQQAILKRIGNYPDKIKNNMHMSIAKLPIDVATTLSLKPSLISHIVNSYCNQDIIDARICKNITYENCVSVKVKFTKCLYAMLVHSKLVNNIKHKQIKGNESILGLKLTCGYEIIMSKLSQDVFSTTEYIKFINNLKQHGYFKDNIEGSQNYKKLLQKANEYFLNMECSASSQICNSISQLRSSQEFDELKEKFKNSCYIQDDRTGDNEDWLNIDPEQLNNLLNTRYGKPLLFKNDDIITPERVKSEVSNFLNKTSDLEGIEVTDMNKLEDNDIEFDSDDFVNSLKKMLNIISCNNSNLDENSDSEGSEMEVETSDLDRELSSKLQIDESNVDSDTHFFMNMIQSMKEEKGTTGPSSNLLRTIGINKNDVLDSDDDE